ncbi:protein kinase domain-containing protein [Sorangium sp. So ce1099]|uniref:protein kinase domain-containing protein n=1 Tax=Sorangium sp. So ce1099 TaxID=3133331 RepID=UPI003F5E612E
MTAHRATASGATSRAPIDLLFLYCREDEGLRDKLEAHLSVLQRQGILRGWHDRKVGAGADWKKEIEDRLASAHLVLVLVSAGFIASDFCYDQAMTRALARHEAGAARVIPVILRACEWGTTPLGALRALPRDALPVTSWTNEDEALQDVARGVRRAAEEIREASASPASTAAACREHRATPAPRFPDAATRWLSEQLDAARARRSALEQIGADTSVVDREILDLKRQLREGGQLREGDSLGDGRYVLLDKIGRGGFAQVFKAYDRQRSELVAVKVLHPNLAGDTIRRDRFFRGARVMAELDHGAIVPIREPHGEDGGYYYFVMDLVAGGDLRQAVLEGRISWKRALWTVLRVADALTAAHAKGLVHRDVKPANILLDAAGRPLLADFDLVGACDTTGGTRTGALGTFIYAAPELMDRPQDADARADVYGLGMTTLFALHGAELSLAAIGRDPEKLIRQLPYYDSIKDLLSKAIEVDPRARYSDAGAFSRAFVQAIGRAAVERLVPREHAPGSSRDALAQWIGEYEYSEGTTGYVWGYSVEVMAADERIMARVAVDGWQACTRILCNVEEACSDRVDLEFEAYDEHNMHSSFRKGDIVLGLRRDQAGAVEFMWAGLQPSLPVEAPLISYVGKYPHDLMDRRDVGRRLRGILRDDYDRFMDCMSTQSTVRIQDGFLVLEGMYPHSGGRSCSCALVDVQTGIMSLIVYDESAGSIDAWIEDSLPAAPLLISKMDEMNRDGLPVRWIKGVPPAQG